MDISSKDSLRCRKKEAKLLLKNCFKNITFSQVPFEIWKDIVANADARSILLLSKTCWGFKETVYSVGETNLKIALLFRKEGQIDIARKFLFKCAENKNSLAAFELGYAYYHVDFGWGLKKDYKQAAEWFRKSAEGGCGAGMALYANCKKYGQGVAVDARESNSWAKKALSSKDTFATAFCHFSGSGTEACKKKAFLNFQASANEGNDFGVKF